VLVLRGACGLPLHLASNLSHDGEDTGITRLVQFLQPEFATVERTFHLAERRGADFVEISKLRTAVGVRVVRNDTERWGIL
jgi:hypothetical protein